MLKFVQGMVIALFVVWISIGSWRSWQLSLNDHQKTSTKKQQSSDKGDWQIWIPNVVVAPGQKTGENHELTEVQKHETAQKEQELAIQRDIARFNHQLVIATWVLGIIGLGTGLVLYFTLRATQTSADAVALNAKAAIGVELPAIIFQLELRREPVSPEVEMDVLDRVSKLRIIYWNMGRSAAEMLAFYVHWRVIDVLPDRPVFGDVLEFAPGSFLDSTPIGREITIELQENEIAEIKSKTKSLWVYGFLRYKDFIGNQHQWPYWARWDLGTKGFRYDPNVPSAYKQKT